MVNEGEEIRCPECHTSHKVKENSPVFQCWNCDATIKNPGGWVDPRPDTYGAPMGISTGWSGGKRIKEVVDELIGDVDLLQCESWTRNKDPHSYTTFMSDISAHVHGTKKPPRCPECRRPVNLHAITNSKNASYDSEGELTHWQSGCGNFNGCGSKLVVFND
jgi:ribosomal protein L37AE/L43A